MAVKRKLELEYDGYTLMFVNRRGVITCNISKDGSNYTIYRQFTTIQLTWSTFAEAVYDVVRTLKGR